MGEYVVSILGSQCWVQLLLVILSALQVVSCTPSGACFEESVTIRVTLSEEQQRLISDDSEVRVLCLCNVAANGIAC